MKKCNYKTGVNMGKMSHLLWTIIGILSTLSLLSIGLMKLFINPNIYGTGEICTWFFFLAAIAVLYVTVVEYNNYKKDE